MNEFRGVEVPIERTLNAFNRLHPRDFNYRIWSIGGLHLPLFAVVRYTSLYLQEASTFIGTACVVLSLFANQYITAEYSITENCGERLMTGEADARAVFYNDIGIQRDYCA